MEELQAVAGGSAFTTTSLFARDRFDAPLRWTGNIPVRAGNELAAAGHDVRALLESDLADTDGRPGPR